MADTHFPDEWLAHSLEGVVTPELLVELREKAPPPARLWETLVAQKIASDEQILAALSTRFRLKLADLAHLDPAAKERVPEQVARRYHILPLRATDSYLEVATATPRRSSTSPPPVRSGCSCSRPPRSRSGWTRCTAPRRRWTSCSRAWRARARSST